MLRTVINTSLCTGFLSRVAHLIRDLAAVAPADTILIGPVGRMTDVEMTSMGTLAPPIGQHLIWCRRVAKWEINLRVDVIHPTLFQPLQRIGIKLAVTAEAR